MKNTQRDLPKSKTELTQKLVEAVREIERLSDENRLLRHALFAPKTEKKHLSGKYLQLHLFDIEEQLPEDTSENDKITVPAHTRRKRGRKPLPDDLPRIEVIHDIPEKDKTCACGCTLTCCGEEVSEKLDIVPAQIRVIRHIRPQYACKSCEGVKDSGKTVKIAPPPAQIIPKGIVTAGLLAHILVAKFCDALPFYRQEKQFIRLGIDIPRQSMSNWAMKASEACQDMFKLLLKDIRGGPLINIDETPVQVLNEPGRSAKQKSYMWLFRGGIPEKPVIIFKYYPTRSGDVPKLFLDDYQGVVQTDGYKGYDFLDNRIGILHVACWAHARRKFMDAKKGNGSKKPGSADKALAMIRLLYALEKKARTDGLSSDEIYKMRQQYAKPIVVKFKRWLNKKKDATPPKNLLGKAVNYCLNQWHRLENYLNDGNAGIDNNVAENAIRPFVLGRKNWLFSGTPKGAHASAMLFSLIETAKANKLEPYKYLRYLFEKLPVTGKENLRNLLPTNLKQDDLALSNLASGV